MKITQKKLRQIIREEVSFLTEQSRDSSIPLRPGSVGGTWTYQPEVFDSYVLFSSPRCSACVRLDDELDELYPDHDMKKVDPTKHGFTGWSRIKGRPAEYERNIVVPTLVSKKGLRYQFEAGGVDDIIDYFDELFKKSI